MARTIEGSVRRKGAQPRKKMGRPKGGKNRPKEVIEAEKAAKAAAATPVDPVELVEPEELDLPEEEHDGDNGVSESPAFLNQGDAPDGDKMNFDQWMGHHRRYVEERPGDFFFYVMRRYPEHDKDGNLIAGTVFRLKHPFSEAWLSEALPEGGIYTIELRGPTKNPNERYLGLRVRYAAFHGLQLPMMGGPLPPGAIPPPPDMDGDGDEADDDFYGDDENERPEIGGSFMEKIADQFFEDNRRTKEKLEQMEQRRMVEARRPPPMPMMPPPPRRDDDDTPVNRVLMKLVEGISAGPKDSEEVRQLHDLIRKLEEARSTEKIEMLSKHKDEMHQRLTEQRDLFEGRLREMREGYEKTLGAVEKKGEESARGIREDYQARVESARDRADDYKQELNRIRDESREDKARLRADLDAARRELSDVQGKLSEARSELSATRVTKDSEMKTAVAEVRMEALRERTTNDDSSLTGVVKQISVAKELFSTLSDSFGGGGSSSTDATPAPKGRLSDLADIAIRVGGSPEIRKLAGTVTKSAAEGLKSVVQARAETQQASAPSTAAIVQAHQAQQAQQPVAPIPAPVENPAPPPEPEPEPTSVIDSVAQAIPSMEEIQAKAAPMLDAIEDHCALGTSIEEAGEEMISMLGDVFDAGREQVIEGIGDEASAADTLRELEFPASRLSEDATLYMDQLIAYARTQKK